MSVPKMTNEECAKYEADTWTLKISEVSTNGNVVSAQKNTDLRWMERRTDDSILQELGINYQLLGYVSKRELAYFATFQRL